MSCSVCAGYSSSNCPVCGESHIVDCPECYGSGINHNLAFNIHTRQDVKVNEITWMMLPATEEEAEKKGQNYCRSEENCPYCKGIGQVRKEDDGYYPLY